MVKEINDVYKEVFMVLIYLDNDLIERIPDKILKKITEYAAESKLNVYINPEKDLIEQNISEESKDFLALIYYNYIASEHEKNKLLEIWNENEKIYQEKFNINNIFKSKNIIFPQNTYLTNTELVEVKKENILNKIIKKLKKIFK